MAKLNKTSVKIGLFLNAYQNLLKQEILINAECKLQK
jgi:hypothetical protein